METYGNPHFGCIFVQPPGKDWANALAAECISSGTAALFQSSASCRMVHSVKVLILMLIQRIFGVLVIDKLIFERMRCWDITIMISYVQLSKSFAVFRSRGAHLHGSMHSANHQGVTSLRCPSWSAKLAQGVCFPRLDTLRECHVVGLLWSLGHLRFSQVRNLGHQLQPLRCGGPTTLPHLDLRETGHAASRCPICGYERICMAESKSQSRSRLRHPAEIPMRSVMICDPWSRAFGDAMARISLRCKLLWPPSSSCCCRFIMVHPDGSQRLFMPVLCPKELL